MVLWYIVVILCSGLPEIHREYGKNTPNSLNALNTQPFRGTATLVLSGNPNRDHTSILLVVFLQHRGNLDSRYISPSPSPYVCPGRHTILGRTTPFSPSFPYVRTCPRQGPPSSSLLRRPLGLWRSNRPINLRLPGTPYCTRSDLLSGAGLRCTELSYGIQYRPGQQANSSTRRRLGRE